MKIAEIEAELEHLSVEELRRLALNSWATFVEKERSEPGVNECDEDDPRLLAALDDAIGAANRQGSRGFTGDEVRSRIIAWTTK